jgi:hypothetical protein
MNYTRSEFNQNNKVETTYGIALNEKQLKFIVECIDIAQSMEKINPDAEEIDIIRRLGKKYEELEDDRYSDYE